MTHDCNKKIAIIKYNALNLADKLQYAYGHTIGYLYNAAGGKLSVADTTVNTNLFVSMGKTVPTPIEVKPTLKDEIINTATLGSGINLLKQQFKKDKVPTPTISSKSKKLNLKKLLLKKPNRNRWKRCQKQPNELFNNYNK